MDLAKLDLHIRHHAYEQYCDRVGPIEYGELRQQCVDHIAAQDYRWKAEFIHLAGIWWVFEVQEDKLFFITCYGQSNIDMPRALRWAYLHNDRINLKEQVR